jgi:hypothetical protein
MDCEDSFETRIPLDRLVVLLELGREFHFDPVGSTEMEEFFADQFESFHGDEAEFRSWSTSLVTRAFRYTNLPPNWIQNPQWPVSENGPMLFVGQIDCPAIQGVFHDETSFYVFFDPLSGERQTIMQIA